MSIQPQTIFFLGATGYLGSQFLVSLNEKLPHFHVIAFLRNATPERKENLQNVYSNISFVEGTLDDDAIIHQQTAKADIVINCASSDHYGSVVSTIAGLETNSRNNPGKPPLYIHVSGIGIVSDNARGGPAKDDAKEWSDIDLDLKQCDPVNAHLASDIHIVEAGSRIENPIRTIIYFPGQIYGLGEGVCKSTAWLRTFINLAKKAGHAGTWGAGNNTMNNIHVKDCADGLLLILLAALEGRADEGPKGLYFSASAEPRIRFHEWARVMGDYLFSKGIVKEGGSRPLPAEILDLLGHNGWSLLGGNHLVKAERLYKLGWEPIESKKLPLLDSFPEVIEQALLE